MSLGISALVSDTARNTQNYSHGMQYILDNIRYYWDSYELDVDSIKPANWAMLGGGTTALAGCGILQMFKDTEIILPTLSAAAAASGGTLAVIGVVVFVGAAIALSNGS